MQLKLWGDFTELGIPVNLSVCGSVQLQNEEEPGETAPVLNDAPPPYSSISAESTGTFHLQSQFCSALLLCLFPLLMGGIEASLPRLQRTRIDPERLLLLVV